LSQVPSIRDARADEAEAIADLHLAVWTQAYRDFAPDLAKALLDRDFRRRQWREIMDGLAPEQFVLVADAPGAGLVAFLFGDRRAPAIFEGRGFARLLYVDPAWQGQGLGRALLASAMGRFLAAGLPGLGLGVLVDNAAAIRFYERCGGRFVGLYEDPNAKIWKSTDRAYVWDDATLFETRAGP
jgi:ribosomal protein S18 acetylase RimI-like enzyme